MFEPAPHRRRRDERGATAVEYSLIAALVAAVVVFAVAVLGSNTTGLYRCTGDSVAAGTTRC